MINKQTHVNKKKLVKLVKSGIASTSALFCITFLTAQIATANPIGGKVTQGDATIRSGTSIVNINQASERAVIKWDSFNIDNGQTTRFNQPSVNAITLNKILDQNPSSILGAIEANGNILLSNPNGILFGKTATIDVNGLVATTSSMADQKFMSAENGRFVFDQSGNTNASIINNGTITLSDYGFAALVAPSVANNGVIAAKAGKVTLAAGDQFTLDLYGDSLIQMAVDQDLSSEGSDVVPVLANQVDELVSNVVNMDGIIEAQTIRIEGDEIVLGSAARINASSATGGEVLIGGDFQGQGSNMKNARNTTIMEGAVIEANATELGESGKVIVWSDEETEFRGAISSKGIKNGNGGFVEVSGAENLIASEADIARIDVSAENGNNGELYLDPQTINIINSAAQIDDAEYNDGQILESDSAGNTFTLSSQFIVDYLDNTGDLSLAASDSINVNAEIDVVNDGFFGGINHFTLAAQNININQPLNLRGNLTLSGKGVDQGAFNIDADIDVGGNLSMTAVQTINVNNQVDITGNLALAATNLNLDLPLNIGGNISGALAGTVVMQQTAGTIAEGIALTKTDGVLELGDGTYNETVVIDKEGFTLRGENDKGATIVWADPDAGANNQGDDDDIAVTIDANSVTLGGDNKGLIVQGYINSNNFASDSIKVLGDDPARRSVSIIGNEIKTHYSMGTGILFEGQQNNSDDGFGNAQNTAGSTRHIIRGNTFTSNVQIVAGFTLGASRMLQASSNNTHNLTIEDNTFNGFSANSAIRLAGTGHALTDNDFNNTIENSLLFPTGIINFPFNVSNLTITGNDFTDINMTGFDTTTPIINFGGTAVITSSQIAESNTFDGAAYHNQSKNIWAKIEPALTSAKTALAGAGVNGGDVTLSLTAGTFTENVVIDEHINIQGAGDTTILAPTTGNALTITTGGDASNNPVLISDLKVQGNNEANNIGISIDTDSFVKLENLEVEGQSGQYGIVADASGNDLKLELENIKISGSFTDTALRLTSSSGVDNIKFTDPGVGNSIEIAATVPQGIEFDEINGNEDDSIDIEDARFSSTNTTNYIVLTNTPIDIDASKASFPNSLAVLGQRIVDQNDNPALGLVILPEADPSAGGGGNGGQSSSGGGGSSSNSGGSSSGNGGSSGSDNSGGNSSDNSNGDNAADNGNDNAADGSDNAADGSDNANDGSGADNSNNNGNNDNSNSGGSSSNNNSGGNGNGTSAVANSQAQENALDAINQNNIAGLAAGDDGSTTTTGSQNNTVISTNSRRVLGGTTSSVDLNGNASALAELSPAASGDQERFTQCAQTYLSTNFLSEVDDDADADKWLCHISTK